MKQIKKRIAEMIGQGAVIQLLRENGAAYTLAGMVWLDGDTVARWVPIHPDHQGHIRNTALTKAVFDNGTRDVLFFEGDELIAGVVPIQESPLDTDEARDRLAEWQALLAVPNGNAEYFEDFLRDA